MSMKPFGEYLWHALPAWPRLPLSRVGLLAQVSLGACPNRPPAIWAPIPSPTIPTAPAAGPRPVRRRPAAPATAPVPAVRSAPPGLNSGTFQHGGADTDLFQTIRAGVPNTAMPAFTAMARGQCLETGHLHQKPVGSERPPLALPRAT